LGWGGFWGGGGGGGGEMTQALYAHMNNKIKKISCKQKHPNKLMLSGKKQKKNNGSGSSLFLFSVHDSKVI
jgi:hypothetical protein